MKHFPVLVSFVLVVSSCCCCSWESLIDSAFSIMNTTEPISAEQFAREMTNSVALPDELENFQAVHYEFPGFSNYYLRYEVSDPALALTWVESLPFTPSADAPLETCQPALESIVAEDFSPNPKVIDLTQVAFWQPGQITDKEYYTCLRFPWSHSLLVDLSGNTVYHVIQEFRE